MIALRSSPLSACLDCPLLKICPDPAVCFDHDGCAEEERRRQRQLAIRDQALCEVADELARAKQTPAIIVEIAREYGRQGCQVRPRCEACGELMSAVGQTHDRRHTLYRCPDRCEQRNGAVLKKVERPSKR